MENFGKRSFVVNPEGEVKKEEAPKQELKIAVNGKPHEKPKNVTVNGKPLEQK